MQVLILTQDNCGFCEQAKEILDRLTVEYPIEVMTLDINSPEGQALGMRGGVMFPPGVFVDGQPFSYGRPSERALRRELDRRCRVTH